MKPSVPLVVAGVCLLSAAAYPSSVPVFSCFELTITAKAFSGNPFDPSQNDIQMVVTDPKGQTVSIPAFYDATTPGEFASPRRSPVPIDIGSWRAATLNWMALPPQGASAPQLLKTTAS